MKPKPFAFTLLGAVAVLASFALPRESVGQATDEQVLLVQIVKEVAAQQTLIAENQAKIDAKVALIEEEIRIARIYAGRTGGKTK